MSVAKAIISSSLNQPKRRRVVPLATIIPPAEVENAMYLNENAESQGFLLKELRRYYDRLHSENHTTLGKYNIWCGEKNKGNANTTLGEKLTELEVFTSVYGHGSYVMQARPEEAPDLEANYPLGIAVFWPGNPDTDRKPEFLTVDSETGRDEMGFEGTSMQYWNVRAPGGSTAQIVDASTPGIGITGRSGDKCLAVTRGSNGGQMYVSTGLTNFIAKSISPGIKVRMKGYSRARTTPRSFQMEIRWMNAAFETISISDSSETPTVNNTTSWTEGNLVATAPEGTAHFAAQVRWLGPPADNETHYLDDVSVTSFGGRLVFPITAAATSIYVHSTAATRPDDSIAPHWPYRAPRATDPIPTPSTTSVNTANCVHWVRIDDEIMAIKEVTTAPGTGYSILEVVRGMWGTTPTAHAEDAKVYSPVYVGSISEGADATFAGSPAVNDATKALRYSLALEQRLDMPQLHRATEWISKRRTMQYLEYDRDGNPNGVPQDSSVDAWANYDYAADDNKSVNSVYLDITGTSFYNMSDSYGYNVVPWTLVGVPDIEHPADSMMNSSALAVSQIGKIYDMREFMQEITLFPYPYMFGNNLAMQSNSQDSDKQGIVSSWALDVSIFEFWINKPHTQPAKYKLQRNQFFTCCAEGLYVCVWAKSGQNGLVGTPFDSAPTGQGQISASDLSHYRRWTYAHFLMGWRGAPSQQYVTEWGLLYHYDMDPIFMRDLGKPIGEFDTWEDLPESNGIKYRDYSLGRVYVNDTSEPVELTLPQNMRDLVDPSAPYIGGKIIPPWDAGLFFAP